MIGKILESTGFMLVLLNPFLVIVYLVDLVENLTFKQFSRVLVRAALISLVVFWIFAIVGDAVFSDLLNANFASFQIFGGIIFLLIGIQFVFKGKSAIEDLRGTTKYIVGAIAMPILIGPGTLSYSVIIGKHLNHLCAILAIFFAVAISISILLILKKLHDFIQPRKEEYIQRYFEIAGRITAIIIGTVSIEMIMQGVEVWIAKW